MENRGRGYLFALSLIVFVAFAGFASAQPPTEGESASVVIRLQPPVATTVGEIMARDAFSPPRLLTRPRETHDEIEADLEKTDDPDAPAVAFWPPSGQFDMASPLVPAAPQTPGKSFLGITVSEAGFIPPDSMGAVGPTQVLVYSNGRIKVFDKAGNLGALNTTDLTFWSLVDAGSQPTDPEVRYDRLTGRWMLTAANTVTPNLFMLAWTDPNTTIDASTIWTFTSFQAPSSTDAACYADFPSLGIDQNALYMGANIFCSSAYAHSSVWIIPKAPLFAGTGTVYGFINVTGGATAGPFSPMGVDNDDPQSTEGYFIGVDVAVFSRLVVRKVSTPGGTPTLGGNLNLTVPTTRAPITQPASGSTTNIDTSDDRLFKAAIHKNKLTGSSTLWTAQNIQVTAACVGSTTGGRNGARWYEITGSSPTAGAPLGGTITLKQSGTRCDAAATNPQGYIFPTAVENGQGHMSLGMSFASPVLFAGATAAGRLRTDATGSTQAATTLQSGLASYTITDTSARNRWGDFSFSNVDPNDDQTIWTFQEYADTPANNWSVRAVQLIAPPPATPSSVNPGSVCVGQPSVSVTLTGTSSSGSEFFDPGPDTGGPGYPNHISATVDGGVTVNSTAIVIPGSPSTTPVTQATLVLDTTAASTGARNVTVANPDGQSATGNGILTVNPIPNPPAAGSNGSICAGATLQLTASTVAGATYSWTGPSGFTSTLQNPPIANAQPANGGTYSVTVTVGGCTSTAATTSASVTANGGSCNDGNACTQTDTCQSGSCVGTNPVLCTASDQCHVVGACNPGTGFCSNPAAPDGTGCSDGNACTQTDTCQSGVCTGSNPVSCSASDQCHVAGTCDSATGNCSNPEKPNGSACNDGNACTQTDTCQTGVCTGSNPVICSASDQCHVAGTCDSATGNCSNPEKPNGSACNDGNACTQTDTCQTGVCTGSNPVICSASDQCHVAGTCNTGTGLCSNPAAPDGTGCNDGNACTQTDTCQSGVCAGSNPVICVASDQCHVAGTCNTGTGLCSNPVAPDGTGCSDGDACTQTDTCQSGVCTGSNSVICIASDQCHVAGTCDPGTGSCSNPAATDGTACSDGNACTQTDTCQSGVCVGMNPVICAASDQCHIAGTCDSATGNCSNPEKPNGSACSDGNACTQTDTCQGGVCTGTNPVICSASDQCHVAGTCNAGTGLCSNPNAPNGTTCSDGNACTQTDTCQSGVCVGTNPVVCTASDQCHVAGTCNPLSGTCSNPNATDGTGCSDGDACTQTDTCQSGACVGANPVVCSASDQCHVAGTCDSATGECSNPEKPDGSACSDGNACTQTDICQSGACVGTNPVICVASDQCHVAGTCDSATGECSNPEKPNGSGCNDGNACTQTDTCHSGVCTGANPVICSASDQCHLAGTCNTGTGSCSNPVKPDGSACNDGSLCTQTDTCQSGACVGANPVTCSASDQCHVAGACNPGTGTCSNPNAADGTGCDDGNACTINDACSGGSCSGGTTITAPPETQGVTVAADKTTYSWSAAAFATRYDVVRGGLGAFPVGPGGGDEVCFDNLPGTTLTDATVPSQGSGFWYLSRGENACGIGAYGNQSNGSPRITTTCP